MEYVEIHAMSMTEFSAMLQCGWRRFGRSMFRPRCAGCSQCVSLRVPVKEFSPNRSQQRNRKKNEGSLKLVIGPPLMTREKLQLHEVFHKAQVQRVGWKDRNWSDPESYYDSFVDNPVPSEEWCYYLDQKLVGVGHVDFVPDVGLSAIYFFHDPDQLTRGLGVWNVLRMIEECVRRKLPHLYLGYWVAGCRSLEYKSGFRPNEFLSLDGTWTRS